MTRPLLRFLKRLPRMALRGTAVLAVTTKLLVPIGFMPGALADGLIVLCPSGLPPGFAGEAADHDDRDHRRDGAAAPHPKPAHDDAHERLDPEAPHDRHAQRDASDRHEQHDDHSDAAQWERCALGGLAGLAALAPDAAAPAVPPGTDAAPAGEERVAERRAVRVTRSRGPPPDSF